ncbi:bifunctional nicotinamidase/pyrazinamidase [Epibacterium sp. DP7N7-1]|nr:bifunctional nicotinamidase/pyrazinamidase [Epibacterium sp. DP7N7-1]
MTLTPKPTDLLVLIDIQNDFLPGGALAVPDGDAILPQVQYMAAQFDNVVLTQDWHPADHASFATNHDGVEPFSTYEMPYGKQVLWPTHCVQGSAGADIALSPSIVNKSQLIIRKGFRPEIDSYSAFLENDQKTPTGLAGYMRDRGLTRAVFAGLALDYCVGFSALDACKLGFEAVVDLSGCRGIAGESIEERMVEMHAAGVILV